MGLVWVYPGDFVNNLEPARLSRIKAAIPEPPSVPSELRFDRIKAHILATYVRLADLFHESA